jgi:signal peptidase I
MRSVVIPAVRTLAALGAFTALAMFSGCSSVPESASAPRSSVSRDHALTLATLTARTVGGEVFQIAPTGSMKPTLDESSVVTVERVAFTALRRGDIIVYRNNAGVPIIHRLYEQHGARWLVLGDNNSSIDTEAVTAGNFVGRVCAIFYTSAGANPSAPAALAQR